MLFDFKHKVFEEIRTMHVSEVFGHLKTVVSNMKNIYEVTNYFA